jgi:hypothetical protein
VRLLPSEIAAPDPTAIDGFLGGMLIGLKGSSMKRRVVFSLTAMLTMALMFMASSARGTFITTALSSGTPPGA